MDIHNSHTYYYYDKPQKQVRTLMMTLLTTLALLKLKSRVSSGSIVLRLQSVTTPLSSNLVK